MRAADGVLLGVLDDDPTGSQAVHGVQVVTAGDDDAYGAALAGPAATCFVLTNTRSLAEPAAAELTAQVARGLIAAAARVAAAGRISGAGGVTGRRGRIQLVSRSDSTLRGHLLAEVAAVQEARREVSGAGFDAVLLVPAFIEAGRLTAAGIHWARTEAGLVPVGETEFARDTAFGYRASDLAAFISEKSGGAISPGEVHGISLADIRRGGPDRVAGLLASVTGGAWVVADATEYSDLETIACGVLAAEAAGKSFGFRSGPSFVRALAGLEPRPPLGAAELRTWRPDEAGHGLIVAGSHVAQTSRQLAVLRARCPVIDVELSVPAILGGTGGGLPRAGGARGGLPRAAEVVTVAARRVADALSRSDVLLSTSRTVTAAGGAEDNLAAGRAISLALASVVRQAVSPPAAGGHGARPAWIVAKGGVTSHDVALHGLRIRRAEVAGQLFPGMISVFRPLDAPAGVIGMPYVVFPGNVGDDGTLAQVAAILNRAGR